MSKILPNKHYKKYLNYGVFTQWLLPRRITAISINSISTPEIIEIIVIIAYSYT